MGMRFRSWVVAGALTGPGLIALVRCGGTAQVGNESTPPAVGGGSHDADATIADSPAAETWISTDSGNPLEAPAWNPWGDVVLVDSTGDCEPYVSTSILYAACCNGSPCRGKCVAVAEGQVECQCFGIHGGCPLTQVCCRKGIGCVDPNQCQVGY
jgi:hypothetical protein